MIEYKTIIANIDRCIEYSNKALMHFVDIGYKDVDQTTNIHLAAISLISLHSQIENFDITKNATALLRSIDIDWHLLEAIYDQVMSDNIEGFDMVIAADIIGRIIDRLENLKIRIKKIENEGDNASRKVGW